MGDLKKLGKYSIQSTLGQGAMGIVYQGFDPNIHRTVAIKTVRKDSLSEEEMAPLLGRFKREAQAAGRLTHPGIVGVYDYDEDGDNAFIAMEYVQGRELKDFLDKNEKFSLYTVIDIVTQLLDALIYSHAQGVVHRDIKPGNILVLGNGQIKIMDFGIAKIESSTLTQFGDVFGTPVLHVSGTVLRATGGQTIRFVLDRGPAVPPDYRRKTVPWRLNNQHYTPSHE